MGEHLSADDVFYRLVDCIYESAMDVAAMPAALGLFSHYTCSASPSYLIWDKLAGQTRLGVTPHGCFTSTSTMPESMRALPSHAALVATADAGMLSGPYPETRTPFDCNGLANGIRLFDTHDVCVWMSATPERGTCPSFDCNQRVAQVMPHWARAARMQHRNFELSGLASMGLAGLDTLDFGVMVLQADMRVRYANSWAEALVQADSNLALDNGVLCAQPESLQSVLTKLLENAVQGGRHGGAAAGSWMHITSGGQPVPIIVMPLVSRQPVEGPWQLPMAMMLLGNSESRSVLDAGVLTSLFGLSRKESIIAIRLAAGETLNEIAEREFLSPHTVRVHIRDTLRKTGTHRQSELVRLLHLLPGVDLERAGACSPARPRGQGGPR
ncbi:helix-turn-helix transcriptional regulator [Cupriavidus sp.]|uniref:helix-turn-helix transcriptional regulator n=1 Tax=Cupriavidus sp. TaxID=1873897 RepID=UPI0025BF25E9|nr:helix-turn-helix transcriptional regulator [Cupriavidus sp.]MCA3183422.1 helix-turn-helix transcriptional regulator [Cupriavidus sp.]MCA3188529.1 helix-turn-helix transcriptional regulator [Cupriavidus sp.]MCA3199519.1 helix-turn-helix transcriptional regulator [Cupriavidus sp.]MCA3204462.1 helix-turn-helix transcriptional regulator [Cupriavidus sp.]MCA3206050.1 helix-turn-helix transcriptional regulator [Cupriavidus sp.]